MCYHDHQSILAFVCLAISKVIVLTNLNIIPISYVNYLTTSMYVSQFNSVPTNVLCMCHFDQLVMDIDIITNIIVSPIITINTIIFCRD